MPKTKDLQTCFNMVWDHFIIRRMPRSSPDEDGYVNACLYRKDRTASCPIRCAAGVVLADEHYRRYFEGSACTNEPIIDALCASGIPRSLVARICDLQYIHDKRSNWTPTGRLKRAPLLAFAKTHALTVPSPVRPKRKP